MKIPRELLARPIAFHRIFVTLTGSLEAALFLSQALYWQEVADRNGDRGWFYKTRDEWKSETALPRYSQEKARKSLVSLGVLEEKRIGVDGKMHFRLDIDKLQVLLIQGSAENDQPNSPKITGWPKTTNQMVENDQPYKEAETTTETTNTFSLSPSPENPHKRATRIPESFRVTAEHLAWAEINHLPDPREHVEAFRDYWIARPGAGGVKLDWDATFRNWIRNSNTRGNGNGNGKAQTESRTQRILRRLNEQDAGQLPSD